jgi:hypothetical protein
VERERGKGLALPSREEGEIEKTDEGKRGRGGRTNG